MSGVCEDRCQDADTHRFYVNGGRFRWCWPKLDIGLRSACKCSRVMLNRYPHNIIGAAVYLRGRGVGLRWRTSR
jgi:hypothetical protein